MRVRSGSGSSGGMWWGSGADVLRGGDRKAVKG